MKPTDTRSVLIPIHVAREAQGTLLHVIARDHVAADPPPAGGTHPSIAGLHYRLFRAGEAAIGAVARVASRPRPLLGGLIGGAHAGPQAALTAINGQDLKGLTQENSGSAELGLALALLMQEARSASRLVYATGALDRGTSMARSVSGSVAVVPVEHIAEKLAGIAESLTGSLADSSDAAQPGEALLFLPATTRDGRANADVLATEIDTVVAAFQARGVTLRVHPVATLEEALGVLGIGRLPRPARERAVLGLGAGVASLAVAGLLAWSWLTAPVTLAFAEMEFGTESRATPLAARMDDTGRVRPLPVCRGFDELPLYRPGQYIVFRAAATNEGPFVRLLGGTRFAVIGLSEGSGVHEWPEELISNTRGSPLDVQIRIAPGEPETNYIVVLGQRVRGFGGFAFRDEVRGVMAKAPQGEKLNAALAYLAKRAPGHVSYKLATAGDDQPCRR